MVQKNTILFIIGKVYSTSSQGCRYRNLLQELQTYNFVTLLSLFPDVFHKETNQKQSNPKKIRLSYFKFIYKKLFAGLLFPDKFIFIKRKMLGQIEQTLRNKCYSHVILGLTPFSFYSLASQIKKIDSNIKIVCDLSDPFLDNGANNYFIPGWRKRIINYEMKHLKNIDALIVLNKKIKRLYVNNYSSVIPEDRIYVIEQGYTGKMLLNNLDKDVYKSNLDSTVRLVYAGGFYKKLREPFELYKAIENISHYNIQLELFGNISLHFLPKSTKVIYRNSLSQSDLIKKYYQSNILVFIDNAYGIQVPGKILELLAINRPILFIYSNEESPSLDYVEAAPQVFKVKNESEQIKEEIIKIIQSGETVSCKSDISKYSWDKLTFRYNQILNEI